MESLEILIEIINEIAKGNYSNDIMPLTTDEQPQWVRSIAESVGMMMVKIEAREYHLEMLIEELRALNLKIKQNTIKTVSAMAEALAARDENTRGHTARVGDIAVKMAETMGLEKKEIEALRLSGMLHDIGKIGFSDKLFQSHGARVPGELVKEIMRHPTTGADILRDLDFLGPVIEYVHSHHERPDGKGYPRKLTEGEIPLGAKILAVADAFDAMTTERPYQKAMSFEKALEIFRKNADQKWDSTCISALEKVLETFDFS